jgi:hypothetical protein
MSAIRAGGGGGGGITAANSASSRSSSDNSNTRSSSSQQQQQQNPALAELRKFRIAASDISRDVSTTSSLLAELSRLVKTGAGGTRIFTADDSVNDRADALVLRIKSSIEGLHYRLEEAGSILDYSKRRLGKNSQAGLEASNLAEQLKEEFGKTANGFKAVLEQRSDGMKKTNDRKRRVIGSEKGGAGGLGGLNDTTMDGGEVGVEERVDLMTLMNKPAVYGGGGGAGSSLGDSLSSGGGAFAAGGGLGMGGGGGGMPTLDLTSGMLAMAQQQHHQDGMMGGGLPAGESSSQHPRPREYFTSCVTYVWHSQHVIYLKS